MDHIIIDSIDRHANVARIEFYGVMVEIPANDLPSECNEGDTLLLIRGISKVNKSIAAELEKRLFG